MILLGDFEGRDRVGVRQVVAERDRLRQQVKNADGDAAGHVPAPPAAARWADGCGVSENL